MSFRHTYITEFLYKHGRDEELKKIREILEKWGTLNWQRSSTDNQLGYFHGVIKDLDGNEIKSQEQRILDELEKAGARIKIVFE